MGKYVIRKLPEELVISKRIEKGTFPEVKYDLQIRPKAQIFANNKYKGPHFALFYCDDYHAVWCNFILRFEGQHDAPQICRCVGRVGAKYHWENIRFFVENNKEQILSLSEGNKITFNF